jgi:bla regulator protein BlaR1
VETAVHFALSNALMAAVLTLPAASVSRFCRRPALAHGLWLLVILKLFTPPLVSVPILWLRPSALQTTSTAAAHPESADRQCTDSEGTQIPVFVDAGSHELLPAETTSPVASLRLRATAAAGVSSQPHWAWAVGLCWGAGSALWLTSVAWRLCRFQRLLRTPQRSPSEVRSRVCCLAQRFRLRRCPDVWFIPGHVSPMLWTWGGPPRLLLPEGLWNQLSAAQQDTLLAHELAHLRRRDHWVRWLELAAVALYWWNPVVWWAQRELQESEEQCCDAWVVAVLPAAADVYAEALLQTLTYLSQARAPVPVGASGAGRVHHVKRRLIMILDGTVPKALSPAGRWAVLVLAAVLLPLWPTWAHTQATPLSDVARPVDEAVSAGPAQDEGREEEINEARATVHNLTAELARLQERAERLSVRLREAQGRLAQMEGKPPPGNPPSVGRNFGRAPVTAVPVTALPTPAPTAAQPNVRPGSFIPQATAQPRTGPPGRLANPLPSLSVQPAANYDQRLAELETKLDRLLEEFKTFRERQPSQRGEAGRR